MQSFLAIDPTKDVDGFHPLNMGRLWAGNPLMVPSTPAGIMEMFKEYGIDLEGKRVVGLVVPISLENQWRSCPAKCDGNSNYSDPSSA